MITVSCQTKSSRFSSIHCWWESLHSIAHRVRLFNHCTCVLMFLLLHKVLEDLAKPGRQWHNVSEPNSPWQRPRCVKGCAFSSLCCVCASVHLALQWGLWCDRCFHTLLLLNETGDKTPTHRKDGPHYKSYSSLSVKKSLRSWFQFFSPGSISRNVWE